MTTLDPNRRLIIQTILIVSCMIFLLLTLPIVGLIFVTIFIVGLFLLRDVLRAVGESHETGNV